MRKLIYCDFANPKADSRNYIEVVDLNHLRSVCEGYLNEFNNMSKKPMNLVLFRYMFFIYYGLKVPKHHSHFYFKKLCIFVFKYHFLYNSDWSKKLRHKTKVSYTKHYDIMVSIPAIQETSGQSLNLELDYYVGCVCGSFQFLKIILGQYSKIAHNYLHLHFSNSSFTVIL